MNHDRQDSRNLADLDQVDETAWLDAMAALALEGRPEELDLTHLAEYLAEMAGRDRREAESRLVVLLLHLLEWEHQPARRSRSWRATVIAHRQELNRLAGRGVLRNHAEKSPAEAYRRAVERASAGTGLAADRFPDECPSTLDRRLAVDLTDPGV